MFSLCLSPPELSSLQISWSEAMELPVTHRNVLLELLSEQREREIAEYRKVSSKR